MFPPLFRALREEGVPVGLREHLTFLEALAADLVTLEVEGFYHLARLCLVKDERHIDRFDRAFARVFRGVEEMPADRLLQALDLPADWLESRGARALTEEERAALRAMGGLDALLDTLRKRLEEQQGRHQGGSKWIGTGGTSPFGAQGVNPMGVRIGQAAGREGRAAKIWDRREFRGYDTAEGLGPRTLRVALRTLRAWARTGAEEFDLDGTVRATARTGWLDLRARPSRTNGVKVLLFLDTGGSMDPFVQRVGDLFAAARSEFRHLVAHHFHNCLYETVWRDPQRRGAEGVATDDLLRTYGPDWRCIFVGDAAMSPYELTHPGGAVEHWNREAGQVWLARAAARWPRHLWINPLPRAQWDHAATTRAIASLFGGRMVPLSAEGLAEGLREIR
jgi:hypothetical protein